jgi:NADPH:quinone reductase-like Zn-dependent oxidoreductase
MKGVQFGSYGDPETVLACVDMPEPAAPATGQVLVQVEFAPVNPNDPLIPRGLYASRPPVPALMGDEGVGRVLAVGQGVANVAVGDRVPLPVGSMTWRDRMLVAAAALFPLPQGTDPKQLSMVAINPPTASLLLSEFVALERGD